MRESVNPPSTSDLREAIKDPGGMSQRIDAFDWSATPLGAIDTWSPALKMMVSILLANRLPMLLWWGPEYISLYNDAYVPVLGDKHPWALGTPVSECWKEIWPILRPLIDTPFHGGPATWNEELQLFLNRFGYSEETHWLIAYSPVPDSVAPHGIGGVLATVHEATAQVLSKRRLSTLHQLGKVIEEERRVESACISAAAILEAAQKDLPFALTYLFDSSTKIARLVASAGVHPGHEAAPTQLDLQGDSAVWPLGEVMATGKPLTVSDLPDRFSALPPGPWTDPPTTAVVLPIHSGNPDEPAGVLILGISSRLRLDDAYHEFLELVTAQLGTAIRNATAYEDERKRAEALAELDRAKTVFFSNVSHEFRTPLTLILGPLEKILSESIDAVHHIHLHNIYRNALRLQKLVNTLLDFSRIEAGRHEARFRPTDLAGLTADLASHFRSACEQADLRLVVDCPALRQSIYVDVEMWEKIVLNLLSNAFKFTLQGCIEVRLAEVEGSVELRVQDTGVGIPADQIQRIFDRFSQVEGVAGRSQEGSGIGLALVDELVKLHGGTIAVESTLGVGTTFLVTLPTGKAHLPRRLVAAAAPKSTALQAIHYVEEALRWLPDEDVRSSDSQGDGAVDRIAAVSEETQGKPRVLIVDDNADMRRYLRLLLSEEYVVEAASDGIAALQMASRTPPDLILTDIMMPKMDGLELLRHLRADRQLAMIPVVMLSARAGEERRAEGMEAGADDYLVKPFVARELLARVSSHLKISRLRRDMTEAIRRSEEQFETLVRASSDVVYRMSADWTEMRYLKGANFIADMKEPSLKWLEQYIPAHHQTLVTDAIARAIEQRAVLELEHQIVRLDGSLGWTCSRAIPVFDERGDIAEWLGMATDITERKEAREALLQSERKLRLFIENAPVAIAIFDAQMKYLICSKVWRRDYELEGLPYLGRSHYQLFPEVAKHWEHVYLRALNGEVVGSEEERFERADGAVQWLRWEVRPWNDASGDVGGVFIVTEDITERKQILAALADSEESYRSYFENLGVGTAQLNSSGQFMRVNERFCQLTSYDRHELLGGMTPMELTHPEDREATRKMCAEMFAGNRAVFDQEKRYLRKDGTEFWVRVTANGVADVDGKIRYTTGIIQDISEQKRIEEVLKGIEKELESELQAMNRLHSLSVRLFVSDDRKAALQDILDNALSEVGADFGSIQLFNQSTGMLEVEVQRGLAQDCHAVFGAIPCADGSDCAVALQKGQPIASEDCDLDSAFPPHRTFASLAGVRAVQWTPLKNREGSAFGVLSICFKTPQLLSDRDNRLIDLYANHAVDFIERVRFQEAMKDSVRKDEFLATLAHELRNPLAPISNAIQLLRRMDEPLERLPNLLEMLDRNVMHMIRMVDDLLEVCRITRGKIELRRERIDLAAIVRNAAETSDPWIKAGGHELTIMVQPSALEVYVDPVRMTQVVANLLNNAAKFTPFGGRIKVTAVRVGSYAVLKVSDNGPGIPDEMLRDIFDLFTQVKGTQRQTSGLGIGLALVKRLIELHEGTVEACHAAGGGAEFIVQIPITENAPCEQEEVVSGEIAAAGSSRRILIVDDNMDAAESLAMLLSEEGHRVATAYDGGSAIEKSFTFNPDLIFLDLGMPGMDGFETAKRIRSLPGASQIRIVALTGWGQEKDRLGTRQAGFQDHLVKPVQISDLQRAIEAADSLADRQDLDAVPWDSTIPSTRDDDASATAPQLLQTLPGEKDRRGSKVAHDFANCFFGIRMGAEVLKRLEICEPSIRNQVLRIADSIDHDCEKGEELTDAIRRFLSESNPNDYGE